MNNQTAALFVGVILLIGGCTPTNTPTTEATIVDNVILYDITNAISQLPLLDIENVENFGEYHQLATKINNLIKILNEKEEFFNIPLMDSSQEGFEKASKLIVEYGPLINNYNEVVYSAKTYQSDLSEENSKKFYVASGKFGFETALIVGTVFYTTAYQGVGILYRAVGMNSLALKCGTCVSIILSEAHWALRGMLVEGSSQLAQEILELLEKL